MIVLSKRIQTRQLDKQFILRQIRPDRQDANSASFCAIHVCYRKLKYSDPFYISMSTIFQLWYPFSRWYSTQQQKYSILAKSDTLFWTHLVFVLCNSYVLTQIEVYRSVLYICWDNILTPTSVMSFVARTPLRYSDTKNHRMPQSVHIWSLWLCDIYLVWEVVVHRPLLYIHMDDI